MTRRWCYLLGVGGVVYLLQLYFGVGLQRTPHDTSAVRVLSQLMVGLYAFGLARTWELPGARSLKFRDALGR